MIILKRLLNKSSFVSSVMKVGSGNIVGQAIGLITMPILSRIYADIAYGDQAIIISTAGLVINLLALGLNSAIMKPSDNEESKIILLTAFSSTVFFSTVIFAFGLLLKSVLPIVSVSGSYIVALIFLWLYIVSTNTQAFVRTYVNKNGGYNKLFFNPIIGAIANVIIAIPLGLAGFGYEGFLITTIVSNIITIIHMSLGDIPIPKKYCFSDFIYVFKEYKEYIIFQCPSNFISDAGTEYPTQFLGRAFDAGVLGGYSMCLRVMKYPIRLVANPISTVYFKTATDYHREGINIGGFTYKMISRILMISFVPVVVFIFSSEYIFAFVLGKQWEFAGLIASILCIQYVMLFCSQCTSYCRVAIGAQRLNLIYSITRLIMLFIACSLGYWITKSMIGTIVFISVAQSICYIFDMGLNFFILDKKALIKYLLLAISYNAITYLIVFLKLSGYSF